MAGWVVPTLFYIVFLGASGVTTKLALRTITWEQMVLWVPIVYVGVSVVLLATGTRFPLGAGGGWAALTAVCVAAALVLFFIALTHGEAATVVPVSSVYPLVTLAGAALFLSEQVTVVRGLGTALVVAGVVLLAR
ncbi:MAG TPA: EamA family transporter [Gaiellaceae bacterium]|nr:EamA family transporter [Gaiellaceae bacterium]